MRILNNILGLKRSKNFKHAILYTIFSFFNNGISFVLILLLARYLTPTGYGYLNLFTTLVTIVSILITLSSASYIGIAFFQYSREVLRKVIVLVLIISTIVLIIFESLVFIAPSSFERLAGLPVKYIFLAILICYFQVFNNIILELWRLEEKPLCYGIYGMSFAILNCILTFFLILTYKMGWEGRVYAWVYIATAYCCFSIIYLVKNKYLVKVTLSRSLIKNVLLYSLPLIPHVTSFWLKSGIDKYIINYFYDQSVVGCFSLAANLAALMNVIGSAFNSTNSVHIYKILSNKESSAKASLERHFRFSVFIFLGILIVNIVIAIGIVIFIVPDYIQSLPYIIPLCIAGFFQCIYYLKVNYLFYYKRTFLLMKITLLTAILQIAFSLLLTRYSPLYTAIISMTIAGITATLVYWYAWKIDKAERRIIDNHAD